MTRILVGMALATFLLEVGNRDGLIFFAAVALLGVWIREAMLHLSAESDRAATLQRMGEWGLL